MAKYLSGRDGMWPRATAALLALTGATFLYIEARVLMDGEHLIVPIAVILVLDIILAGVIMVSRKPWLSWLALGVLVVGFAGDLPHQYDQIAHPTDVEHVVVSIVALVVQIAGIAAAGEWGLVGRRRHHDTVSVARRV